MHPLERCSTRSLRLILLLFLIATAAFTVFFAIEGELLVHPEAPYGILSFEFVWSLEGFARIVDPWNELAISKAIQLTWIDFGFLISYSTLLAAAVLLLGRRAAGRAGLSDSTGRGTAWLSWIAATCDIVENAAGLKLLLGTPKDPWPLIMSCFALVKFTLLAIVLINLSLYFMMIVFFQKKLIKL